MLCNISKFYITLSRISVERSIGNIKKIHLPFKQKKKMKKLVLFAVALVAISFASCKKAASEAPATADTTAVAADSADTTAVVADTTAVAADTAAVK